MHLRKLEIGNLPGIDPGFVFEPGDPGVHIVTGPNAIGKSSLVRALKHLLTPEGSDPPGLALTAEFADGGSVWQVRRSGSDVVWDRDGQRIERPEFVPTKPNALHRLSIEHLLDGDASDEDMAERLRRELYGNYDLGAARLTLRKQFRKEVSDLTEARHKRREVESEYAALQRSETQLPELDKDIAVAEAAQTERDYRQTALDLVDAIDQRKQRADALALFPPHMDRLHGVELDRLDEIAESLDGLRDDLRDAQRQKEDAEAALDGTGLGRAAPAGEEIQANQEWLRHLQEDAVKREAARIDRDKAAAAQRDAQVQFGGDDAPPQLYAGALRDAEKIAYPLLAAQASTQALRAKLALTTQMPEHEAVVAQRNGVHALRRWLATRSATPIGATLGLHYAPWLIAGALLCVLLFDLDATPIKYLLGWAAVAVLAQVTAYLAHRAVRRPSQIAQREFQATGLAPPAAWDKQSVEDCLCDAERRLDDLCLQQHRAGQRESLESDIRDNERKIADLNRQGREFAMRAGFDPQVPATDFYRYAKLCGEWDRARLEHAEQEENVANLDRRIADTGQHVREFLGRWRPDDAPSLADSGGHLVLERLQAAFGDLQARTEAAAKAQGQVALHAAEIKSLEQRIADADADTRRLYEEAGVEPNARQALAERLDRLPAWRKAGRDLAEVQHEESRLRRLLDAQPDLVQLADEGKRTELEAARDQFAAKADTHTELVKRRASIDTQIDMAGNDRRLEQASAAERRAEQALDDKRGEALLAVATDALLDDVEQAFETDHEPAVLRQAREAFAEVTAHAFDLELVEGSFVARDVKRNARLALGELSAGTRMQVLLALRLAWTFAREQGFAALPLFLDEALTTSDEHRFAVMAQSLTRLASSEERPRQIFYLCARGHEATLWRQATGSEPNVIDLANVRFPSEAVAAEDFAVEPTAPTPPPGDLDAAAYASVLGVANVDPYAPATALHLFHVLRDDLDLLHALVDKWRIMSLGQLDGLLASDAAASAVDDPAIRGRLAARSRVAQVWTELRQQGRGRPVDRGALEQSGAVSGRFIASVAELAEDKQGDGEAIVAALRDHAIPRFHRSKIDDLEQWLADEEYTDERPRLDADVRRRETLQRIAADADVDDIGMVVTWLESTAADADA